MDFLKIELTGADRLELTFNLLDSPITQAWLERMSAREEYKLDDATRFYGFNSYEEEARRARLMIADCIETINSHEQIIDRVNEDVWDQDYLNYLHNIFERYHGLLDQQNHEYWVNAPDDVKQALANLNIAVHRCESVAHRGHPRFVCTWFGLPKIKRLSKVDMEQYGCLNPVFGSVCINYAEIGKTLEDLSNDDDKYIAANAFQPFSHVSADFVVRFFNEDRDTVSNRLTKMKNYYMQHKSFFHKQGYYSFDDTGLQPLRYPVAQLIETMPREELLNQIRNNQYVSRVSLV